MKALDALRKMVDESGLTRSQISTRLGRYESYMSQILTRTSVPGADTLASIAEACGYRLALVPTDGSDPIVIGDDAMDPDETDRIEQARALLIRATALLEDARS